MDHDTKNLLAIIDLKRTKKSIISALCLVAVVFIFAFIGWILSGHGTIGLLRLTPIALYALIFVAVIGLTLIGLFLWYFFTSHKAGRSVENRLSVLLSVTTLICILLIPFLFIQLGGLPPARDIKPATQLSIRNASSLHFAVGSDAHFGAGANDLKQTQAMLDQISDPANKYDAFFFLGDLVEHGFSNSQWKEALDTFSTTMLRVPTRFAPGNHDTLFGGLSRYIEYCSPPAAESRDGSKLWHQVDTGNVHFLVLDVEWSAETFTQAQETWLGTQLAGIPSGDWKILMSHGFYYSSGISSSGWNWYDNPETISTFEPLFEKYGVDMVFSGHNHCLEILKHSGIYYMVCGGFGGKLDPVPTYISSSSAWLQPSQFGFADVNIEGDQANLNFRDPAARVLKTLTITK